MLNDIRDLDFKDIGAAPLSARLFLLALLFIAIIAIAYFLLFKEKRTEFDRVAQEELGLRTEFEEKQQKAANLEAYRQQLADMQELLESMLRQLPSKTEMDKLLVDVSQTALGAGIENQLFQPRAEVIQDFYAERPISIRMVGNYHQFGDFVSGVASLPRVVILTMHDIALRRQQGGSGPLVLEGTVKTYRYVDNEEQEANAAQGSGP